MTDKRYQVGIGVTVLYVVALGVYACVQRGPLLDMTPNEFGDALAGAASPLAFLWLVLGYLQQGEELRQNTEALKLQARELHDAVEQQKALVTATQLQHEFEIQRDREQRRLNFLAKQPRFHSWLREDTSVYAHWELTLKNLGHTVSSFDVDASHESSMLVDGEEEFDFTGNVSHKKWRSSWSWRKTEACMQPSLALPNKNSHPT
jgi:hypothetical protein